MKENCTPLMTNLPDNDDWMEEGTIPLPIPEEEFRTQLFKWGPDDPVERLRLEDEGEDNIDVAVWEREEPAIPFLSSSFVVYLRAHGTCSPTI